MKRSWDLRALAALAAAALLVGCPTGDDDDTTEPETVGDPPAITSVELCQIPGGYDACSARNMTGAIQIAFQIKASDPDGDLVNPRYFIRIDGLNPWREGIFEATLAPEDTMGVRLDCDRYTLGVDIAWEVQLEDSDGNESPVEDGSWTVPVAEPDLGEPDACPSWLAPID